MKLNKYKLHPWHGIHPGENFPEELVCYVEVVPGDEMKYEIDKQSGYLIVDRPNLFSNVVPVLYGFIPMTYCAENVAGLCMLKSGKNNIKGDGDPLDICILTDRSVPRGDILVNALPIGGFRMIDKGEADDKIIAVLKNDHTYGHFRDLKDCPRSLIKRIKHYFLTYKDDPDLKESKEVIIDEEYGYEDALEIIRQSRADYINHYE